MTDKKFPKVLIIVKNRINQVDGPSAALRNWFYEWPKENLAQIYSYQGVIAEKFCGNNYLFGGHDKLFGWFFDRLKYSKFGINIESKKNNFLIESGIWELFFPPRISYELAQWVKDFSPEIIYMQGWDISFIKLPLKLQKIFKIPICLHMTDDWPLVLYLNSKISAVTRFALQHNFRELIKHSSIRFSVSELMTQEYKRRYHVDFETMMVADETQRFFKAAPKDAINSGVFSIIYTGGLGAGRWQSILDLYNAIKDLDLNGKKFALNLFSFRVPIEIKKELLDKPGIYFFDLPSHEELPSVLKSADLLFLPESFDKELFSLLHLSISTKAHLYMMSERPILAYGPAYAGVVDYAKKSGWAYVVEKRDENLLRDAVIKLLDDKKICEDLIERGRKTVATNHDATLVRENFRVRLVNAINENI